MVRSILFEMIKAPYFCFYIAASVNYTFPFPKLTFAFCNKAPLLYLQVDSKTQLKKLINDNSQKSFVERIKRENLFYNKTPQHPTIIKVERCYNRIIYQFSRQSPERDTCIYKVIHLFLRLHMTQYICKILLNDN